MKIAICEDRPEDGEALETYIRNYCGKNGYICDISLFASGEALLAAFSPGAYDLIFLDIYLTGITGVDAAKKIRESDRDCLLMFITGSEDHAMDGFLVHASGYVVKPLRQERMDAAMHMCRQAFERNSRTIAIPIADREQAAPVADILYAEVFGKETVIHMKKGVLAARIPLSEIESRLGGAPFLRCHRCYIVNMNHIADLRENDIKLTNGETIPMRKNGRKEIRLAVAGFIAG